MSVETLARTRPQRHGNTVKLAAAVTALLWSAATALPPSDALRTYPGERIGWRPCGQAKGHDLECSELDVPMDQFDASNSGDKTFNLPLIRMRGRNATQNLLLNPGGPGESGMAFLYTDGAHLRDVVGDGFHLLSFDPRGINKSRPAARCYPNKKARQRNFKLSDPDAFSRSEERFAWTQNYIQGCIDNMGEHGRYINTPQTAADMNSILDAVGQRDMVYWGFSYGTLLGQTYAALFPKRSSRIVIDGVGDYFDWYGSPILRGDFLDTMNVFDGFFDECVKAGDRCALSHRARTKEELRNKVMGFLRYLEAHPIPVYVDAESQGVLTYGTVLQSVIYPQLYTPATWHVLARHLTQIMDGNATQTYLKYGDDKPDSVDEANDIIDLNDGASGPGHWPKGRQGLVDYLTPWYESTPFFFQMNREYYAKQQWAIPRTHSFVPPQRVRTAHPMLIVSTTYDPICPLASAKVAQQAFEDSRLVEIKGYGHCSLAQPSLCMARHLRAYLEHGTTPDSHTLCDGDRPYFHPHMKTRSPRHLAGETEDDKIRAAQLAMSKVARGRRLR